MRRSGFLLVLFLHACFGGWLQAPVLFAIGEMSIYAIDVVYALLLYVTGRVLFSNARPLILREGRLYVLFLGWLLVAVVLGLTRYGYRALGEARYVVALLSFFVPFFVHDDEEQQDPECLARAVLQVVGYCAVAGLLVYALNASLGLVVGMEDFRGVRYIDSSHTFYITVLVCSYVLRHAFGEPLSFREYLLLVPALAIAVLSKNRAGLIMPVAALVPLLLGRGKIRVLGQSLAIGAVALLGVWLVASDTQLFQVGSALAGALDPSADQTGAWRLAVQAAAFEESLETFWFGQGYGGYFSFVVPGLNWNLPIEYPPHNQFLVVFMKAGVIGTLICLVALVSFIVRAVRACGSLEPATREHLALMTVLVILGSQILYGLVYDFIPLYGLYFGYGVLLMSAVKRKQLSAGGAPAALP